MEIIYVAIFTLAIISITAIITVKSTKKRLYAEVEKMNILERQFQKSQKLESLGVLASGIAHDFNNVLTVIFTQCAVAQRKPEMAQQQIHNIEKAANKAADLCKQLMSYAGKNELKMTKIDIVALLEDMVNMLRTCIGVRVSLRLDAPNKLPYINGDCSQLRQIIMNLVINAKEAMTGSKGCISVNASRFAVRSCDADLPDFMIPVGEYVLIKVVDNGCGMDEIVKQKIFDPFFTTKPDGQGLGMSAILGIVNNHKGLIRLESNPGKGTTFYIYIPIPDVADIPENMAQKTKIPANSRKKDFSILVVDDDDIVREVAKALLEKLGGNKIHLANNGKEGLEMFLSSPDAVDLVITDLRMPVMSGWDLIREIRKTNKDLPIYASTGFRDETIMENSTDLVNGFLSKPYSFESMGKFMKDIKSHNYDFH